MAGKQEQKIRPKVLALWIGGALVLWIMTKTLSPSESSGPQGAIKRNPGESTEHLAQRVYEQTLRKNPSLKSKIKVENISRQLQTLKAAPLAPHQNQINKKKRSKSP